MSFLSRLFGSNDPLGAIRKSYQQGRWADVLARAVDLDDHALDPSMREELQGWVNDASDRLARLNLDEGEACLRGGDLRRGLEHLELARQLARSAPLASEVAASLSRISGEEDAVVTPAPPLPKAPATSCASSCCTQPGSTADLSAVTGDLDEASRLELVLTAYPEEERERYRGLSPTLRQAVLLAHEGEDEAALRLFAAVANGERNDLHAYEFGALLGRMGRHADAVAQLKSALAQNPGHLLAMITLVDLYLGQRQLDTAEQLLTSMLAAGFIPEFCYGRMAVSAQLRGDRESAFQHANEALRLGARDAQLILLVAAVLEEQGRLDDAEQLLASIPTSGGCCGGANVDLAEFWLRHNKKLQQALEAFKKAAKGEPGNPVWGFHIARVYLALGWKKDAVGILETLATSDMVEEPLRRNARQLLQSA